MERRIENKSVDDLKDLSKDELRLRLVEFWPCFRFLFFGDAMLHVIHHWCCACVTQAAVVVRTCPGKMSISGKRETVLWRHRTLCLSIIPSSQTLPQVHSTSMARPTPWRGLLSFESLVTASGERSVFSAFVETSIRPSRIMLVF